MSEARVIACNNCGSRYKLPPTFQGSKVRCKKCSAAIDIESSIVKPEAPATPAPAKAKARSRPAEPAKKAEKAEAKRPVSARRGRGSKVSGSRSSRGRRGAATEEEDEVEEKSSRRGARGGSRSSSRRQSREGARGRRGRGGEDEVEAKSKTPMMLGIGGGVALLAVALFFLLGGKDDPKATNAGQGNKVATTATDTGSEKAIPELPPEEGSAEEGSKVADSGKTSGDGASGEKTGKAEEASAKGKGETKEAAAKKKSKKTAKKTPKKKLKPGERSTPFDPMTETEEVAWTEDTTDEEKKTIAEMVETTFVDTAAAGMRAGRAVSKYGRKAFPAILNRLRSVDYMDHDQHLQAYALHEILKTITLGRNAGYNPTIPVTQGAAWWNAMTVKIWIRFWTNQVGEGDPAAWKKFIDIRKKKQKAEGDDEDF